MAALYTLNPKVLWAQFRKEHFAFWMMCAYMTLQYLDPLRIYQGLAWLPLDKVVLILALMTFPMDPRRRRVQDSANVLITLFLLVILLSCAVAIYPSISWGRWFDFVEWYIIYFLIINIVTTSERYFIFLAIFLVANFKMSFFGARTWAMRGFGFASWGLMGPPGYFQNSSDFSGEMLMFAPIAFELALYVRPYVRRLTYWFLMLGAVTGAMSVLGASSRGSQLALVFQGGWIAIQRKLKLKIVLALAIVAVLGYALLPAAEKARFSSVGTDKTSIQRLDYWREGVKMIERHPFLGVGYFNFAPVYASHAGNKLWHGTTHGTVAQLPHNIFIQVGTDTGLTGLTIFLALIGCNLKRTKDIRRACKENPGAPGYAPAVARGLMLTTWGFVIAGQFNTVSYYPFLWINLALTVSLASIVKNSEKAMVLPASQRSGIPVVAVHQQVVGRSVTAHNVR
jgi:O-antigen ligase